MNAKTAKEEIDLGDEDFGCVIVEEPIGVVAAITPWNYPVRVYYHQATTRYLNNEIID